MGSFDQRSRSLWMEIEVAPDAQQLKGDQSLRSLSAREWLTSRQHTSLQRPDGDRGWTAARLPAASRPGHQPIPHRFATIRLRYDRPSQGRHLPRSLRNYTLVTLKDAANYIQKLPKAEQDLEEWQAAVEALIMAAEGRGPVMHSRIGVLRALNRNMNGCLLIVKICTGGSAS